MLVRAWPRMRLTWTTSRRMSMIRWLAKVWRRSWKRTRRPGRSSRASATARRSSAAAARELVTNVDDAGGEVDVIPAEREQLGETHARERPGEKQRPVL